MPLIYFQSWDCKKIMKPFYLYILQCADQSYYVGHTDDHEKRFLEHFSGVCQGYTKTKLPVTLVYSAVMWSRDDVFKGEFQIKKSSRKKKEALINGNLDMLLVLAKKQF